jgi:hypothetical protein
LYGDPVNISPGQLLRPLRGLPLDLAHYAAKLRAQFARTGTRAPHLPGTTLGRELGKILSIY